MDRMGTDQGGSIGMGSDQGGSIAAWAIAGDHRFPAELTGAVAGPRRFEPDKAALKDALEVVRALDSDSYQALLWALGLTPDSRLSVPGCGRRSRAAG